MVTLGKAILYQRKCALIAGVSIFVLAVAAFVSYSFIHGKLFVADDPQTTYQNVISHHLLFNLEIFGWIIVMICDIVVSWSFYIFLKPINQNLSLLAAWFRLTYAAILGIAIMNLLFVLLLSNNADDVSFFSTEQLQMQVWLYLNAFNSIWSIGLIVFGGHLLIIGWLAFKSNVVPKLISILLFIAAIGYIVIHLCKSILPQFVEMIMILELVFSIPMIAGEFGFGLWLLFRGGKVSS
jgi:hypothetical protein